DAAAGPHGQSVEDSQASASLRSPPSAPAPRAAHASLSPDALMGASQEAGALMSGVRGGVHQPREPSRPPAESAAMVEQVLRGATAATSSRKRAAEGGDDLVQSLCADQARVDEVIKLARTLWDSGALSVSARPLPLLKASLLFRLADRCHRHTLRDALQILWRRANLQRSWE
ncbi:unnamed protein product, partial [Polarella glacialis]